MSAGRQRLWNIVSQNSCLRHSEECDLRFASPTAGSRRASAIDQASGRRKPAGLVPASLKSDPGYRMRASPTRVEAVQSFGATRGLTSPARRDVSLRLTRHRATR